MAVPFFMQCSKAENNITKTPTFVSFLEGEEIFTLSVVGTRFDI